MERHDIKPDWTVHNGGFGGKPEPEPETVVTEPEATEPKKEAEAKKPVSRGK